MSIRLPLEKSRRSVWNAWRCAGWASFALAGCVVVNVAGCGGGTAVRPPSVLANVTIVTRNANGAAVSGIPVTLNGVTQTATNGRTTFNNLAPGNYTVTTVSGGQTTSSTLAVSGDRTQAFVLVVGQGFENLTVNGRILQNPGDGTVANCGAAGTEPLTAPVMIRVRKLSDPNNQFVVSFIRPAQINLPIAQRGNFSIQTIPGPGTYRVEVRPIAGDPTSNFSGNSASFTIAAGQTINNLVICANSGLIPPPPPPPGATPTATATANATATAGATAGATTGATPGATTGATANPTTATP